MLCQNCKNNNATTHLKQNVNGQITECWLCAECAEKLGLGGMFSGFGSFAPFGSMFGYGMGAFESMLGSLFGASTGKGLPSTKRCEQCGSTLSEISHRGTVGCAGCYETFKESLAPSIERMHRRAQHTGRLPSSVKREKGVDAAGVKRASVTRDTVPPVERRGSVVRDTTAQQSVAAQVAELKRQLQQAIASEEYEKAAQLRDRIRALEVQ